MFHTPRLQQIEDINKLADMLVEKVSSILKTRTIETDYNMLVDVVSILPKGTEIIDIKAMHRISPDSRIIVSKSSIEDKEEYMILRFQLSFALNHYSKEELENIKNKNEWYKNMEQEIEEEVRQLEIIRDFERAQEERKLEKAIEQHQRVIKMMSDDNQDIYDFDFNQDPDEPELTPKQKEELFHITKEMNRKEKLEKLRENINIINKKHSGGFGL